MARFPPRPLATIHHNSMHHGPPDDDPKQYSFVPLGGHAKKRPRRRYDEIERLYRCSYEGCNKAYGTLNHLNAHVSMQRHGPKRSPAEFKELRKLWRKAKKDAETASGLPATSMPFDSPSYGHHHQPYSSHPSHIPPPAYDMSPMSATYPYHGHGQDWTDRVDRSRDFRSTGLPAYPEQQRDPSYFPPETQPDYHYSSQASSSAPYRWSRAHGSESSTSSYNAPDEFYRSPHEESSQAYHAASGYTAYPPSLSVDTAGVYPQRSPESPPASASSAYGYSQPQYAPEDSPYTMLPVSSTSTTYTSASRLPFPIQPTMSTTREASYPSRGGYPGQLSRPEGVSMQSRGSVSPAISPTGTYSYQRESPSESAPYPPHVSPTTTGFSPTTPYHQQQQSSPVAYPSQSSESTYRNPSPPSVYQRQSPTYQSPPSESTTRQILPPGTDSALFAPWSGSSTSRE